MFKLSATLVIVLLALMLSISSAFSVEGRDESRDGQLRELKKAVVFLGAGTPEGKSGTGFLLSIGEQQQIFVLVTAKHMVIDLGTKKRIDEKMQVFFNTKDGKSSSTSIESIKQISGEDWFFHDKADLALIPFPVDLDKYDMALISDSFFLSSSSLSELDDVFFCAYQPNINYDRVTPLLRSGKISLVRDDGIIYIDATGYPGNSGSPVFRMEDTTEMKNGAARFGLLQQFKFNLVGVVSGYIPSQEDIQDNEFNQLTNKYTTMANTGITTVSSVEYITEIIQTTEFQNMVKKFFTENKLITYD